MTSRGDPRKKLEYTFDLYDIDRNGFLEKQEMVAILTAMLDMLVG